ARCLLSRHLVWKGTALDAKLDQPLRVVERVGAEERKNRMGDGVVFGLRGLEAILRSELRDFRDHLNRELAVAGQHEPAFEIAALHARNFLPRWIEGVERGERPDAGEPVLERLRRGNRAAGGDGKSQQEKTRQDAPGRDFASLPSLR